MATNKKKIFVTESMSQQGRALLHARDDVELVEFPNMISAKDFEAKQHAEPGVETFDTVLDVTEPMGMETLIYFTLEGAQICGRVNPNAGARDGGPLRLAVDLNNMHLLNEVTGVVL